MKELILSPKGLFVVLIIIAVIVAVQFGIVASIEAWTKVSEGPCTFKSWSYNEPGILSTPPIRLNLNCNGKDGSTKNVKVILGYLTRPGPLTCSLWASGKAFCQVPK